jgi:poly(A)-specific ribonuclease
MRETDELWWRRRRKEAEEPSDEELNQFLGFSRVFKIIADSNIPIVGHSVLLDILHTYTHFIDDLPKALEAFKSEVNKRLTSIYDTLVLCENSSIRACLGSSLSLANVYSALAKPEFPQVTTVFPESCATYGSGNHFHEAAYDAYLSGYVFLMVVRILGGENAVDEFKTVESFKNRVYLFNCESADSLNLTGQEVRAPRDHIFYLTFPREVTTEDIKNLFSPFGGCRVSWINETSARVSLHHRKKAEETYKALAGGGSMGGHLFSISKEQLKPPTSTTNNDETSEKCTLLGKRKKLENTSEAPPTTKVNMFQESVDW